MSRKILTILWIFTALIASGQPKNAFFVIHCDPNESYNFPNLEKLIDSANVYQIKLTIEFTAPWIDSILPFPPRKNKIRKWQSQGHEIGMHHHEISAHGIWDGYSNYSMIEIHHAGRDTNNYIGDVDSLYRYISQITPEPIYTIGTEDSVELPTQVKYQTTGHEVADGFSNPILYIYDSRLYCKTSHCLVSDVLKEQQLESQYPAMGRYTILGANCHVYNFVSAPLPVIRYFRFLNQNGIKPGTVSGLLHENCVNSPAKETDVSNDLYIYPNPVGDKFTISLVNTGLNISQVIVYNSYGQPIKNWPSLPGRITVEADTWPRGIYFVAVQTENKGILIKKVVKN